MFRVFLIATVAVVLAIPSIGSASGAPKEGVHFAGIGGHLRLVDGDDPLAGRLGFGLQVDLGNLSERVRLYGVLYRVSGTQSMGSNLLTTFDDVSANEWGLSAFVRYYLNPEAAWMFYLGGGLGIYRAHIEPPSFDENSLGIDLGVGVQKYVGEKVSLFVELAHKEAMNEDGFDMGRVAVGLTFHNSAP